MTIRIELEMKTNYRIWKRLITLQFHILVCGENICYGVQESLDTFRMLLGKYGTHVQYIDYQKWGTKEFPNVLC